jgi:hypothetical protein
MASAKKSGKSGSKQPRVQVRDMKPKKDAKGGKKLDITASLQDQNLQDANQQKVSPQSNSQLKF